MYKNCQELYNAGHTKSDEYKIKPDGVHEVNVFCVQDEDGGGWTVSLPLYAVQQFSKVERKK